MKIKGIILSGSAHSVNRDNAPQLGSSILELNLPVLGLCYGLHLLAKMHGGELRKGEIREYGVTKTYIEHPEGVLEGIGHQLVDD